MSKLNLDKREYVLKRVYPKETLITIVGCFVFTALTVFTLMMIFLDSHKLGYEFIKSNTAQWLILIIILEVFILIVTAFSGEKRIVPAEKVNVKKKEKITLKQYQAVRRLLREMGNEK